MYSALVSDIQQVTAALITETDLCGKQIKVTNTQNGKSVTAVVADVCPTCANSNSLDLSVGAFVEIATEDQGIVASMSSVLCAWF